MVFPDLDLGASFFYILAFSLASICPSGKGDLSRFGPLQAEICHYPTLTRGFRRFVDEHCLTFGMNSTATRVFTHGLTDK